jgi:hypothetical protein
MFQGRALDVAGAAIIALVPFAGEPADITPGKWSQIVTRLATESDRDGSLRSAREDNPVRLTNRNGGCLKTFEVLPVCRPRPPRFGFALLLPAAERFFFETLAGI